MGSHQASRPSSMLPSSWPHWIHVLYLIHLPPTNIWSEKNVYLQDWLFSFNVRENHIHHTSMMGERVMFGLLSRLRWSWLGLSCVTLLQHCVVCLVLLDCLIKFDSLIASSFCWSYVCWNLWENCTIKRLVIYHHVGGGTKKHIPPSLELEEIHRLLPTPSHSGNKHGETPPTIWLHLCESDLRSQSGSLPIMPLRIPMGRLQYMHRSMDVYWFFMGFHVGRDTVCPMDV